MRTKIKESQRELLREKDKPDNLKIYKKIK